LLRADPGPEWKGKDAVKKTGKALTQPSPTGRGLITDKPSPAWGRGLGEGGVHHLPVSATFLTKAGVRWATFKHHATVWLHACSGNTRNTASSCFDGLSMRKKDRSAFSQPSSS